MPNAITDVLSPSWLVGLDARLAYLASERAIAPLDHASAMHCAYLWACSIWSGFGGVNGCIAVGGVSEWVLSPRMDVETG